MLIDTTTAIEKIIEVMKSLEIGGDASLDASFILMGAGSSVDSQSLLKILLGLEEVAEDELSSEFEWMTDAAFSEKRSPFRTIASLAEFFANQVNAAGAA
jgi:hypothetical protein